tara:strand:- start:1080 stop:2096 length:1017 start_codon:yes stop_codon:yes gene_type:complete
MLRQAFILTLVLASLPAQELPKARQFHFDQYSDVVHLDFAAMRDHGVWPDVEVSRFKVVLRVVEKELGFPLSRLDRLTSVAEVAIADGEKIRRHEVSIYEGNAELLVSEGMRSSRYQQQEIGGLILRCDRRVVGDAWVQVGPHLRVVGDMAAIKPVLAGKPRSGVPCADVLSLVAERGLLGYGVFDASKDTPAAVALREMLPDARWPAKDQPTFACIRVRSTGKAPDSHLLLELVVRHGTASEGLAATEVAVTKAILRLTKMPELRQFKQLLSQVHHERAGIDAIWRVDLGSTRSAIGVLAPVVVPVVLSRLLPVREFAEAMRAFSAEEKPAAVNDRK